MTRIATNKAWPSLVQRYLKGVTGNPNPEIIKRLQEIDWKIFKREAYGTYQNDPSIKYLVYFLMKHLDQQTTLQRVKELRRDFGIPLTHAVNALEVLLQLPENISLLDIFIRQKLIPTKLIPYVLKAHKKGIPISLTQSMKECIQSMVIKSGLLN